MDKLGFNKSKKVWREKVERALIVEEGKKEYERGRKENGDCPPASATFGLHTLPTICLSFYLHNSLTT